jgi:hypothetical protein
MPTYVISYTSCSSICTPPPPPPPVPESFEILLNKGTIYLKNIPQSPQKQIIEVFFEYLDKYLVKNIDTQSENNYVISTKIENANIYYYGNVSITFYEDISDLCNFSINKHYINQDDIYPSYISVEIQSIDNDAELGYIYILYSSNTKSEKYIIHIQNNISELINKSILIYDEDADNIDISAFCVNTI